MVGLLGTVTGMIFAFQQVASTRGAAGAGDLAEGIYQALVTTVCGLVVAIPALAIYAVCRNRVDSLIAEVAYQSQHALAPIKRTNRTCGKQALPLRVCHTCIRTSDTRTSSQSPPPGSNNNPAKGVSRHHPETENRSRHRRPFQSSVVHLCVGPTLQCLFRQHETELEQHDQKHNTSIAIGRNLCIVDFGAPLRIQTTVESHRTAEMQSLKK